MKPDIPSSTALLIARGVVFVAKDARLGNLVPPGAAEASVAFLKAASSRANRLLDLMGRQWFRTLVSVAQSLTIPGIVLHYVVRKRYLEDVAREAIASGAGQIVVLGAGFDTLALRLSQKFSNVTFIEVDHPATQKVKAQVLKERQDMPANFHLLTLDLSQNHLAQGLLNSPHYKSESRTLFIAEGLLMYLEAEKVEELFQFVAEHSTRGSGFAFTFLEPQRGGQIGFRGGSKIIDLWLDWRKEGFRWGIKRQKLAAYVEARGLSLRTIAGAKDLRTLYLKGHNVTNSRLAQGEYIGVAELETGWYSKGSQ